MYLTFCMNSYALIIIPGPIASLINQPVVMERTEISLLYPPSQTRGLYWTVLLSTGLQNLQVNSTLN